jgi:glycosyltransferase involved in cell wall biosynthesis
VRVLYHHRTSASDGSAVHIDGLVEALRSLGAEVRVVAPPIAEGAASSRRGISALRRRLPRLGHELGEVAYNVPEARRLGRAIAEFKPDVIYQRSNLYLLSGASLAARCGLPLIEEVNAPYFIERSRHGGIAWPALAQWAEKRAWRSADAVVAVTQVLADIVARTGAAPDRLHVMPNGIDASLLRADAVVADAKARLGLGDVTVLGFTGYVRDWNGLDGVLDVLSQPFASGCVLLVVGDGPARAKLEARARQLGVAGRVRFTGVVARAEVPKYVSAFDIALQPAANPYASPLKLFEYLALGRAVIAPRQPNIVEVLEDGRNALLFDPQSRIALGDAIRRLAGDGKLRTRLSVAARETVLRRDLTWRRNAERVLELAESLRRRKGHEPSTRALRPH